MAIESMKSFFKGKKESGSQQDVANEEELVGTPHAGMEREEAERIISSTISRDSLLERLKSELFLANSGFSKLAIEHLARLVLELRERIPQYDTVLSDDASGRLLSLLIRKIINKTRDSNVPIYFLAGGRDIPLERKKAIKVFLKNKKDKLGRVLLITEYLDTGESMKNLTQLLRKENIVFDVASLVTTYEGKEVVGDVIYGGTNTAPFFYRKMGAGVTKKKIGDIKRDQNLAHPQREKVDPQEERLVREDLDITAEELVKLLDYEA